MASSVFLWFNGITGGGNINTGDGTAAVDAYGYSANAGLGQYRIGTNNEGFSAGAALIFDYNTTRVLFAVPISFTLGTLLAELAAGQLLVEKDSTHGVALDVATDGTMKLFSRAGADTATFTSNVLTTTGQINGGANIVAGSSVIAGAGSSIQWSGRGLMSSSSDGVFNFNNSGQTTTAKLTVPTGTANVIPITVGGPGQRQVGATAAQTIGSFTVGAADGSFEVSANILITTATTHSFNATVAYTDEGNTSRTATLSFSTLAGVISNAAITNVAGAVPYEGVPYHIRCKAATTITVATTGTFTAVVYNAEGIIKQTA